MQSDFKYKNLKQAHPKLKLPSFLLGYVLFLAGAATAATVSALLIDVINNVVPRGASVFFSSTNMVFIALVIISRMVYGNSKKLDLSKLSTEVMSKFKTPVFST